MIPVGRNEVLSRFAEIPAVLQNLHKSYPAITWERFHPGEAEPLFCANGIPLGGAKFSHIITSACLNGMKKLTHKFQKIHISTFQ